MSTGQSLEFMYLSAAASFLMIVAYFQKYRIHNRLGQDAKIETLVFAAALFLISDISYLCENWYLNGLAETGSEGNGILKFLFFLLRYYPFAFGSLSYITYAEKTLNTFG
ncbi:hypothetical protein BKA69DRAFT_1105861, partial [Paraphysoderma sedebokerense]